MRNPAPETNTKAPPPTHQPTEGPDIPDPAGVDATPDDDGLEVHEHTPDPPPPHHTSCAETNISDPHPDATHPAANTEAGQQISDTNPDDPPPDADSTANGEAAGDTEPDSPSENDTGQPDGPAPPGDQAA
ncbi:hypothetical protein [Mycolicibacterium sp.]|uniref:hypothetical protein n=1 Tax=Mycolicibacterium sp. TaxID=2320850 RepID=UPI003D0A47B1